MEIGRSLVSLSNGYKKKAFNSTSLWWWWALISSIMEMRLWWCRASPDCLIYREPTYHWDGNDLEVELAWLLVIRTRIDCQIASYAYGVEIVNCMHHNRYYSVTNIQIKIERDSSSCFILINPALGHYRSVSSRSYWSSNPTHPRTFGVQRQVTEQQFKWSRGIIIQVILIPYAIIHVNLHFLDNSHAICNHMDPCKHATAVIAWATCKFQLFCLSNQTFPSNW